MIKEVLQVLAGSFPADEDKIIFDDDRGDGKHFSLIIVSEEFENMSKVDRSKMVYKILNDYIDSGLIHALKLKLKTHNEFSNGQQS